MSGLVNVLVIVVVAAIVIARQFRARAINTDRRWWLIPVVLAVVALREPGILDAHHRAGSAVLLVVELVIGVATGAGWAWTTRIWTEPDGVVWTKSTKASVAVWIVGIALRIGIYALGAVLGLHQDSSALMCALAVTLLVRGGILVWRAQSLSTGNRPAPAYGDGMRSVRRERV
ncbi:membrane protein [Streptomyces incarnatus]|uniref:Membrane protein n=1 Tax=Streptomyces incarnatus TaxID=665007 RepID=A0ABN4GF93_9ACTN|nr:CcdC protein domain-containing protein [Streptomyces incarnatus]AKJ10293.1 membrane protein [Streptomyces incarnatus]